MQTEHALEIHNLTKCYGNACAVNDVSFQIKKGEIFGLLGPNGAGKSTIIKIITGVGRRDSGKVNVLGKDVTSDYMFTRRNIGVVPQEVISDGYFTVYDIMRFQSGFYGIAENDEKIDEILSRLQLFEHKDKRVEHLSGGMKRRLLVAKALVHSPPFLILDEPTAGVDVQLRITLWDYMRELNENGVSILLTTHYIEEAQNLCHRAGILNLGQIQDIGTVEELLHKYDMNSLQDVFIALTSSDRGAQ